MTTINHKPYWVAYFDLKTSVEWTDTFTAEELELLKLDPSVIITSIRNNIIDVNS